MATNIDGILEATRVGQQVLDGVMRLVPAGEKLCRLGDKDAYWRPVQKLLDNGTLVEVSDGD